MTSAELNIGVSSSSRPTSRVLKPPGGGHSNIFGEAEVSVNAPRPKYNQQNSSNMNACMGSTDPNQAVVKLREEIMHSKQPGGGGAGDESSKGCGSAGKPSGSGNKDNNGSNGAHDAGGAQRGRIPPGGFSSGGFW